MLWFYVVWFVEFGFGLRVDLIVYTLYLSCLGVYSVFCGAFAFDVMALNAGL